MRWAPAALLIGAAVAVSIGSYDYLARLKVEASVEAELQDAPTAVAKADRDYVVEQEVRDAGGTVERTYYRGYALPESCDMVGRAPYFARAVYTSFIASRCSVYASSSVRTRCCRDACSCASLCQSWSSATD